MPHVVFVGFNLAGALAIQPLFQEISASSNKSSYSVTVISASEKIYFNIAAPRLIVEPELIDSALFPIEPYLKKHSNGVKFQFIHAKVEQSDFNEKTVQFTTNSGSVESLSYDILILASGTRGEESSMKLSGDYKESCDAVKALSSSIKKANTIAIVGGGATGVETAGEIAYTYPKKSVTLYTGSSGPLSFIDKAPQATKRLNALGVKVVNNLKSTAIENNGSTSSIKFDDGSSVTVDVCIPTYGSFPNTEYIGEQYLDKNGFVIVDEYLRVKGHKDIVVIGDVANTTVKTVANVKMAQLKPFTATLNDLINQNGNLIAYAPGKTTIGVPISRNGGVGIYFGIPLPSFLIKVKKGKDFMLSMAKKDYA